MGAVGDPEREEHVEFLTANGVDSDGWFCPDCHDNINLVLAQIQEEDQVDELTCAIRASRPQVPYELPGLGCCPCCEWRMPLVWNRYSNRVQGVWAKMSTFRTYPSVCEE